MLAKKQNGVIIRAKNTSDARLSQPSVQNKYKYNKIEYKKMYKTISIIEKYFTNLDCLVSNWIFCDFLKIGILKIGINKNKV